MPGRARFGVFDAFIRARGVVPNGKFSPLLRSEIDDAQFDELSTAGLFRGALPFQRIDE